jgi:hypothetical protein
VGEEVATCNCAWGCPCQFNALPTHGRCEAVVAVRIHEGHYGATRLDGVTCAAAYWWPGALHEPIKNPVTGEEHRARIDLPNGFEYKLAEMANCLENKARVGDRVIANTNSYAQFASIDWTNA